MTDKLTVLVPLDNTSFSEQVLTAVAKLFPPDRASVRLLHIAQSDAALASAALAPATLGADGGFFLYRDPALLHPLQDEETLRSYREEVKSALRGQVERLAALGYQAQATILFGEPVREIVAFAEDEGVDVLAMTTHARSGFDRFLLGSVAQDVARKTSKPVLTVRLEDAET